MKSTTLFALFLASLTPAAATPVVYQINVDANPTSFGSTDLGTLTYTQTATESILLLGLASANGELFAAGYNSTPQSQTLYQIGPTTGAETALPSPSGFAYVELGSTLNGLYGMDASGNLYSVDATTGAGTLIGDTGLTPAKFVSSLSNGSDTLYLADSNGDLYTLNTTNGSPTLVGFLGTAPRLGNAIPLGMSALDFVGGTLYAEEGQPGSNVAYTVNTSTGAATVLAGGFIPGNPGSAGGWTQIVAASSPGPSGVPEPASVVMVGGGLASLLLAGIRRRTH